MIESCSQLHWENANIKFSDDWWARPEGAVSGMIWMLFVGDLFKLMDERGWMGIKNNKNVVRKGVVL